jgi:glycosyltransferase involved in cell wall biosynthesis
MRAADHAVRHADLINVPNEGEASSLREEVDSGRPIIVQSYGLTVERRQALGQAAAPAEIRLAHKKVSFVGMWAARKGSHDWATIMRGIRQKIPETQFCFLGTMVDANTILSDLRIEPSAQIELVSDYSPVDLPALLADCAVGAFPSYVEGFGLAVLEQLAAGIPTVAFDVAGPRDILGVGLPDLLVPSADLETFVNAICKILQLDLPAYQKLSERSAEVATQFCWERIAEETLSAYRNLPRTVPIA